MVIVNSDSKTICRTEVIGEWEGTICPICYKEVCDNIDVCEAEYNGDDIEALHIEHISDNESVTSDENLAWHEQVEDEYLRMDEKEALAKFKAMW